MPLRRVGTSWPEPELLAEPICNQLQPIAIADTKMGLSAISAGRRRRKRGPQQLLKKKFGSYRDRVRCKAIKDANIEFRENRLLQTKTDVKPIVETVSVCQNSNYNQ